MTLFCRLAGHSAGTVHYRNQGLDFAICHHCGCDLIRADAGDWAEVPRGFRVVWRSLAGSDDAAGVAVRMQRTPVPPRRRAPRGAARTLRRDRRGRPLRGAASVIALFAGLGRLIEGDPADSRESDGDGQSVICLPGAGG